MKTKHLIISKDAKKSIEFGNKLINQNNVAVKDIFSDSCYSKIQNDIENIGNGYNKIIIFDLDKHKTAKITLLSNANPNNAPQNTKYV